MKQAEIPVFRCLQKGIISGNIIQKEENNDYFGCVKPFFDSILDVIAIVHFDEKGVNLNVLDFVFVKVRS